MSARKKERCLKTSVTLRLGMTVTDYAKCSEHNQINLQNYRTSHTINTFNLKGSFTGSSSNGHEGWQKVHAQYNYKI